MLVVKTRVDNFVGTSMRIINHYLIENREIGALAVTSTRRLIRTALRTSISCFFLPSRRGLRRPQQILGSFKSINKHEDTTDSEKKKRDHK